MSFAGLSNEQQIECLTRLASSALVAWDLAEASIELVKYRENAVFVVTAADASRAILRIHRPHYRSDDDIRSEIAWMSALGAAGIEVPSLISTRSGDCITVAFAAGVPEPRQCDLMTWVPGVPPGTLEGGVVSGEEELRSLYQQIGSIAAHMHEHALAWQRPAFFSRPSWNVSTLVGDYPTFGRFWELEAVDAAQMRVLTAARDRARQRLSELPPAEFLIHGDLVPDNILVEAGTARVIDFDDFGWSWAGFEMATSLFPLQISGGLEAGLAGYLEGYNAVRAMPQDEVDRLPDMLMARGLSYLGWPVGRPEIESARALAPMFAAMMTAAAEQYLDTRG